MHKETANRNEKKKCYFEVKIYRLKSAIGFATTKYSLIWFSPKFTMSNTRS